MKRFSAMAQTIFSLLLVTFLVIGVGCGSQNSNGGGTGTGSGTGTGTGSGTGTGTGGSSGVSCTAQLKVGSRVLFRGTQGAGTSFPDATKSYIGVVETLFSTSSSISATVNWPAPVGRNTQNITTLRAEGSCTPDIAGRRVLYTGSQNASNVNFPDPAASYTGTLKSTFGNGAGEAMGWAEVDWDHLAFDTVESFSNVALSIAP